MPFHHQSADDPCRSVCEDVFQALLIPPSIKRAISHKDQGHGDMGACRQHETLLLLSVQVSKIVSKHNTKYRSFMFNIYKVCLQQTQDILWFSGLLNLITDLLFTEMLLLCLDQRKSADKVNLLVIKDLWEAQISDSVEISIDWQMTVNSKLVSGTERVNEGAFTSGWFGEVVFKRGAFPSFGPVHLGIFAITLCCRTKHASWNCLEEVVSARFQLNSGAVGLQWERKQLSNQNK